MVRLRFSSFIYFFYLVGMILPCYIVFIQLMFGQNESHSVRSDVRRPGWSCRVREAKRKNVDECSCMRDRLHQQSHRCMRRQDNHALQCDLQNMGWWLPPQNPEEQFCTTRWLQAHTEEICEYSFPVCTVFSHGVVFCQNLYLCLCGRSFHVATVAVHTDFLIFCIPMQTMWQLDSKIHGSFCSYNGRQLSFNYSHP